MIVIGIFIILFMFVYFFFREVDKEEKVFEEEENRFKFKDKVKNKIGRTGVVIEMHPATQRMVGKTYTDYTVQWDDSSKSRELVNNLTKI